MDNEEEKTIQLTEKQRVFVERYCVHFNGAKACREAGYSEETARTMAHENLTKPDISEAINAKLRVLSMSAEEATKRLTDMGRGSIESFLNVRIAHRVGVYDQFCPTAKRRIADTVHIP